ncbi:hypothetical protein CMI45_01940 [Candidatus Pacearchaeota archaeon]|nr:hypothetical protein [Candidatus Pacearchaeota archaeon]|tara:strand:- start:794 stop:1033 length:240 start_codon:yes stop_codon:yes gene_type:complete
MLCCPLHPFIVAAKITDVRHCLAKEVTEQEYKDDGFDSQEEMIKGMKAYYHHFGLENKVTVLRWNNVHGAMADDYWMSF